MADRFNILYNYADSSFNPLESRRYRLAVSFHPASFSCAVLDPDRSTCIALHQSTWETGPGEMSALPDSAPDAFIAELFKVLPWLRNPYLETRIAWEGPVSTLIPNDLYLEEYKERYLGLSFGGQETGQVFSDTLRAMNAQHIYSIPDAMMAFINDLFPRGVIMHAGTLFLDGIAWAFSGKIDQPHLFLNMRSRFFDLMVYDGTVPVYYNSFGYIAPEDVVYYVIFVMEQLSLNPDRVPLVLVGNITDTDPLYTLLYRYIRQVDFGNTLKAGGSATEFDQLDSHAFFSLLNLYPCE